MPPRDEHALAAAVVRLLRDPDLRRRFGLNGKRKLDEECAPADVARHTVRRLSQSSRADVFTLADRRHLSGTGVMEINGPELVRRYKANYGIPDRAAITEEMVLHHWTLERRLTTELLSSDPAGRWNVFERCYSTLYSELPWLNELSGAASTESAVDEAEDWSGLIGPPPKRVYEIGSGKGRLAAALADRGYECTATEITRERGQKWTAGHPSAAVDRGGWRPSRQLREA